MKNFVLQQTDLLVFPLIAFVLFFAFFLAMLVWVYRPGGKAVYAERSRLALHDGSPEGHDPHPGGER